MSMQVYTATCTINHVARTHCPVGHSVNPCTKYMYLATSMRL